MSTKAAVLALGLLWAGLWATPSPVRAACIGTYTCCANYLHRCSGGTRDGQTCSPNLNQCPFGSCLQAECSRWYTGNCRALEDEFDPNRSCSYIDNLNCAGHFQSHCNTTCTVTSWTDISSCSAACGGGTKTQRNNCGGTRTVACNTQDCCSSTHDVAVNACGNWNCGSNDCVRFVSYRVSNYNGQWCGNNCQTDYNCPNCCSCAAWVSQACGGWTCAGNQRHQTRSCTGAACTPASRNRCVPDSSCASPVEGRVFDDPGRQSALMGPYCDLAGASGVLPGSGTTVQSPSHTASVATDGAFSVLAPNSPPDRLISLSLGDPDTWVCVCPTGCRYAVTQTPPGITGVNFYVSQTRQAWFQTVGGDLLAGDGGGATALRNPVPASCAGSCKPFTTLRDALGTVGSSGVVVYHDGSVDSYDRYGDQTHPLDEDDRRYLVETGHEKPVQNFAYFRRRFEMPLDPGDDFAITAYDAAQPSQPPLDGNPAYFHAGDMTIRSHARTVGEEESYVVFVDGDLTIATTSVDPGGYLGFIVSGDIVFPATLGDPDPAATDALVEGVFIADGTLRVESVGGTGQDLKFIGEGSFIGLSGVRLDRDYRNTPNNQHPTELFRFRPDLLINTPQDMKKPLFQWQPVAP